MSERSFARRFIIGIFMGSADLVPGVSGGTIAFVAGVFEPIIEALHSADRTALRYLFKLQFRKLYDHLNLGLILSLLLGVATAIFVLSTTLHAWLDGALTRPRLFSFFLGLVVVSILLVAHRVSWERAAVGAAAAGVAIGFLVISTTPANTPSSATWAILSGAFAISAMVLPGISGAFILLLAGQYDRAITAASDRDFTTLALFAIGAVVGVLTLVRALRWALVRWHNGTLAALVGLMVGTAPRLWPWGAPPTSWALGTGREVAIGAILFFAGIGVLMFFQKLVGVRTDTV
jgi:putative membrane protein